MKLKLKPAAKLVSKQPKPVNLETLVKKFLDGAVRDSILEAETGFVNVEVPTEAYGHLPEFYKLCTEVLKPLGYKASSSHDGGGMYNTLAVEWKLKKA